MTNDRPVVNADVLGNPPADAITAIISAEQEPACVTALMTLGLSPDSIEVLKGEDGRAVLDLHGRHHSLSGHLKRAVQGLLGSSGNETLLYDSALASGKVVIAVSVTDDATVSRVTQTLISFGGDRINHFGRSGMEQL